MVGHVCIGNPLGYTFPGNTGLSLTTITRSVPGNVVVFDTARYVHDLDARAADNKDDYGR